MSCEKSRTILVVDDEESMRDFLMQVLADEGYEAVAAESGQAALEVIEDRALAVVVLDMRLPGLSGREVLCRIRQDRPFLAVVMMTAYPSEEALIECMRMGAVRFLIKPFPVEEFLRVVAGAMQDTRTAKVVRDGISITGGFRDWVELTAPSRQEYLDRLENFVDALYDARVSLSVREDLKIAVSEIVANAMEWGNRADQRRCIRVSYCLFPEEVVFKVEDEGEGFRPEDVPAPASNPVDHILRRVRQGKRGGGYGMHIVRKIMDKVIYSEKGNVVILSKSIGAPGAALRKKGASSDEQ